MNEKQLELCRKMEYFLEKGIGVNREFLDTVDLINSTTEELSKMLPYIPAGYARYEIIRELTRRKE